MQLTRRVAMIATCGAVGSVVTAQVWTELSHKSESPTRGRGLWTAFGSVAVLAADEAARRSKSAGHSHVGQSRTRALVAPAAHEAWTRVLQVKVELHNGLDRAVVFSPGQFRLRLGHPGRTVTPYDSSLPTAGLAAHSTTAGSVSYLVPELAGDVSLEFSDAVPGEVISIPLSGPGHEHTTGHAHEEVTG